ncbi:hypothetical protein D3C85_1232940 [compost metagenome]
MIRQDKQPYKAVHQGSALPFVNREGVFLLLRDRNVYLFNQRVFKLSCYDTEAFFQLIFNGFNAKAELGANCFGKCPGEAVRRFRVACKCLDGEQAFSHSTTTDPFVIWSRFKEARIPKDNQIQVVYLDTHVKGWLFHAIHM